MRWPWRHRPETPPVVEHRNEQADEALLRLEARQPHVDELERWARRERQMNSFSERMRRGMGGA